MGLMQDKPWETESGATDEVGFLKAYAEDDNVFWAADTGHIQNVLDFLIGENDEMRVLIQNMQCTCLPHAKPYDGMCERCMALDRSF